MGLKRTRHSNEVVEEAPARRTRNKAEPERPNKRARRVASPPPPLPNRSGKRGRPRQSPEQTIHVRSPPRSDESEPSTTSADELDDSPNEQSATDDVTVQVSHSVTFEGKKVQETSTSDLKLDKKMAYTITEMVPNSLRKAEVFAEQRNLRNCVREIKADVIVGDDQHNLERTIGTFQFVNDTTIGPKVFDLEAIEAMVGFVKDYATRVRPPTIRLNLTLKFGSGFKPVRTEILEPKMKQTLEAEMAEYFKCPDRTCMNFGSSCLQLNSEHIKIDPEQEKRFCDPGIREDKTMATTILELAIDAIEKRSEKHPEAMTRDEVKGALAQMPFLKLFLPRVRPLPEFAVGR
ncbi:hypothetical protein BCR34DRAFT_584874 [Clohesyomyces aquaticus]|uniref:Uncharacterized protein n=1 Tax=Clohesyomyces aquaticus TaxID=1231657 RepID=A0A1Y1ZZL1_9PLEO|nr:hypothetical protein BCR34DRAFT_584874 [Clohesyomyces aquaticus]